MAKLNSGILGGSVSNVHPSRDLVLSDRSVSHRLPLSGTWMKCGPGQCLLCNNTRFDLPVDSLKSFPFPIKVFIDMAGNPNGDDEKESYREWRDRHLNDEAWIEELLPGIPVQPPQLADSERKSPAGNRSLPGDGSQKVSFF